MFYGNQQGMYGPLGVPGGGGNFGGMGGNPTAFAMPSGDPAQLAMQLAMLLRMQNAGLAGGTPQLPGMGGQPGLSGQPNPQGPQLPQPPQMAGAGMNPAMMGMLRGGVGGMPAGGAGMPPGAAASPQQGGLNIPMLLAMLGRGAGGGGGGGGTFG